MSRSPENTINQTSESLPAQRRILTIDDNPDILADYRKVLRHGDVDDEFEAIETALFGASKKPLAAKVRV